MTVSAVCRLRPLPAALMDSKNMNAELPGLLNLWMFDSLHRQALLLNAAENYPGMMRSDSFVCQSCLYARHARNIANRRGSQLSTP